MGIIVFGHRGVPSLETENSLDGFKKLLELNVKAVELDIHLTKDGELVVIHDFNTLRMTGTDYEISQTDYKELNTLSIGENQKIPLLKDVFNILGSNVFYDLEVKSRGSNCSVLIQKLYQIIKEYNLSERCIVSSFDPLLIHKFNKLKTSIPTSVIYSRHKDVPFILRSGLGALITNVDIIKPHHTLLKGPMFFFLTRILKKKCYTWTVNSKEVFEYAVKRGCTGICTNFPQEYI